MVSTIVGGHYVGLSMTKKRRRRRHWHDDEKCEIVAQARQAGVSVARVARRYDVNANLVFKWLRDPRFKPMEVAGEAASFVPVEIAADPAPPMIEQSAASKIEIALSNGHCLCITGAFDPDAVSRLVHGLSR